MAMIIMLPLSRSIYYTEYFKNMSRVNVHINIFMFSVVKISKTVIGYKNYISVFFNVTKLTIV